MGRDYPGVFSPVLLHQFKSSSSYCEFTAFPFLVSGMRAEGACDEERIQQQWAGTCSWSRLDSTKCADTQTGTA